MTEPIEHTPYEWICRRGRVVLLRRYSLKLVWGFCVFLAGYITLFSLLLLIALLIEEPPEHVRITPLGSAVIFLFSAGFVYVFVRIYKTDKGVLVCRGSWPVGSGVKLSCEVFRLPQPTTMGGTLQGPPMKWLVLIFHAMGANPRLQATPSGFTLPSLDYAVWNTIALARTRVTI